MCVALSVCLGKRVYGNKRKELRPTFRPPSRWETEGQYPNIELGTRIQ